MTCEQACEQLPLHVYGELAADETQPLETHLAGCPACRAAHAEIERIRQLLCAAPAPTAPVIETAAVYRRLADAAGRRVRRWKWAASFALASAAGLVALLLLGRVEVRMGAGQLVVRWGGQGSPTLASSRQGLDESTDSRQGPGKIDESWRNQALEEQVAILNQIVRALARDAEVRSAGQDRESALFRSQLNALQHRGDTRLADLERDFRTLYRVHFALKEKGDSP
jgi:hypothetical protein